MTSPPSGGRARNQSFPGRPNSAPTGHATGSAHAGLVNINYVNELSQPVSKTALEEFVRKSFIVYDEQANFALDWTQAAHHDEEIKLNGMKRHLQMCRRAGAEHGGSHAVGPSRRPSYKDWHCSANPNGRGPTAGSMETRCRRPRRSGPWPPISAVSRNHPPPTL